MGSLYGIRPAGSWEKSVLLFVLAPFWLLFSACGSAPAAATTLPLPTLDTGPQPSILGVSPSQANVPAYERLELIINLQASYQNPLDARQVTLTAAFSGPDGKTWTIPGFWDADHSWRVRFAPPLPGAWTYRVQVKDAHGDSAPVEGSFTVTASGRHGYLQVASWVNPAHSPRYLAFSDGTPFYGLGQCDAFDLARYGFDPQAGFTLFTTMQQYGLNMLVYWPLYSYPFLVNGYGTYQLAGLKALDLVVEDAEKKGIYLIWTVWDHNELRDKTHPWREGVWEQKNGFHQLGDLRNFFTSEEAWAWQENLYRYMIARWGSSPAIGLWQTVSEINGTNAGALTDTWHKKVNDFFVHNDPYRHPTTASKSGDEDWPAGYAVDDVPQIHSYASRSDVVGTGPNIAGWTLKMWAAQAKPNLVGEFGTPDSANNPDQFHNAIWAGLAAGAAITPLDWNDSGEWGRMTPAMFAQLSNLGKFIADLPLAHLNPAALSIQPGGAALKAWGVGGKDWGLAWLQDVSLAGRPVSEVRRGLKPVRAALKITGLSDGAYRIRPYDTWMGSFLPEIYANSRDGLLEFTLPEFKGDVALRLEKK